MMLRSALRLINVAITTLLQKQQVKGWYVPLLIMEHLSYSCNCLWEHQSFLQVWTWFNSAAVSQTRTFTSPWLFLFLLFTNPEKVGKGWLLFFLAKWSPAPCGSQICSQVGASLPGYNPDDPQTSNMYSSAGFSTNQVILQADCEEGIVILQADCEEGGFRMIFPRKYLIICNKPNCD